MESKKYYLKEKNNIHEILQKKVIAQNVNVTNISCNFVWYVIFIDLHFINWAIRWETVYYLFFRFLRLDHEISKSFIISKNIEEFTCELKEFNLSPVQPKVSFQQRILKHWDWWIYLVWFFCYMFLFIFVLFPVEFTFC